MIAWLDLTVLDERGDVFDVFRWLVAVIWNQYHFTFLDDFIFIAIDDENFVFIFSYSFLLHYNINTFSAHSLRNGNTSICIHDPFEYLSVL